MLSTSLRANPCWTLAPASKSAAPATSRPLAPPHRRALRSSFLAPFAASSPLVPLRGSSHPGVHSALNTRMTSSSSGQTTAAAANLLSVLRAIVPELSSSRYKGQAGKVGVVGGCREYTGAPYFASISALKVGADLSHVFCVPDAAPVIKSYSPELIVHPSLPTGIPPEDAGEWAAVAGAERVEAWFSRLDALVVGPGLGRDPTVLNCAERIVRKAMEHGLPVILDADGLYLVTSNPDLVKGYAHCVLTPNVNEFRRLQAALGVEAGEGAEKEDGGLGELVELLEGPRVIRKGAVDAVAFPGAPIPLYVAEASSKRRCGGQGDVLAGTVATFVAWALAAEKSGALEGPRSRRLTPGAGDAIALGCYGGCLVTRRASQSAFAKKRRAMVASDVIDEVGVVMEELFPTA